MNKLISQFKINEKPKLSDSIEILFDFAVVALVSLIFNGFIINDRSSVFEQKYLMVANAMLLSTHWYAYNFFRQRYEKRNSFSRVSTFFSVIFLAVMAIGIDLMVFRENSKDINIDAYNYLGWAPQIILLSGYVASRTLMALKFSMAAYANKDYIEIKKLTIWKAISRIVVAILASVNILLIFLGYSVDLCVYIFFPIYLLIEIWGNLMNVKDKYLEKAPDISMEYIKTRYSKLNLLYISSFIISGTIQFAFYFKTSDDLFMLPRLLMVYVIAFSIWWTYMDRMHRFSIKKDAFNLKLIATINVILVGALAVIGGMLINANKDTNLSIIIPTVFIASSLFLLVLIANIKTFDNGTSQSSMNNKTKYMFIGQVIPIIILFITMGVISIYFSFSLWVLTGTLVGSFTLLNIASRYTINKYIKNR